MFRLLPILTHGSRPQLALTFDAASLGVPMSDEMTFAAWTALEPEVSDVIVINHRAVPV
jgi:hypothetical protein